MATEHTSNPNHQVACEAHGRRCPVCSGNDWDIPCAFPREQPLGCWRTRRFALSPEEAVKLSIELGILEYDWYR